VNVDGYGTPLLRLNPSPAVGILQSAYLGAKAGVVKKGAEITGEAELELLRPDRYYSNPIHISMDISGGAYPVSSSSFSTGPVVSCRAWQPNLAKHKGEGLKLGAPNVSSTPS
jgi:hypothetical protein